LAIGPPTLPPNWFWSFAGLIAGVPESAAARFEMKSILSMLSLRKKSYTVPWKSLVPDLVETLIAAPGERPYSAE
jgi:hypothetical protein